jgi:uncharacterized protein YndB with AHSA1/START domain
MTHSRLSAELDASPEAVWKLVGTIRRWPEWDVTYQTVSSHGIDTSDGAEYQLVHQVGNRRMLVDFQIAAGEPGRLLVAEGKGNDGEQIVERFELAGDASGGTTLTRETTYTLPGQTLGVAASTTYAEASVQRWAEQAFARLAHVVSEASRAEPVERPGDVDTRSTDSGPISSEESYSANLEADDRLPQAPRSSAPERPT